MAKHKGKILEDSKFNQKKNIALKYVSFCHVKLAVSDFVMLQYNYKICGKINIIREDLKFSLVLSILLLITGVVEMQTTEAYFKLDPNLVRHLFNKNQGKKLESNQSSANY